MVLFVPYLLHTLQQAARHVGLEADPCGHKGDGLWARSRVSFCRIFLQRGWFFFFLLFQREQNKANKASEFTGILFKWGKHFEGFPLSCQRIRGLWGWRSVVPGRSEAADGVQGGGLRAGVSQCSRHSLVGPPSPNHREQLHTHSTRADAQLRHLKKVVGVNPSPPEAAFQYANSSQGLHSGQQWVQARCPALKCFWAKQHQALVKLGAEVGLLQQQLVAYISDLIFKMRWTSDSSHGLQLGLLAAQQFWKSDHFFGYLNMGLGMLALATPTYRFLSCCFCSRDNPKLRWAELEVILEKEPGCTSKICLVCWHY